MNEQDEMTLEQEVLERPEPDTRTDDLLTTYLQDIGKIDRITPEEEIVLARRIQNGDRDALNQLVEANLRFVITIAKKYQGCGMALSDLINEGNLGIIEAAKRFDPTRGVKFISYAIWWIRQSIMQALAVQGSIARLPLKQAGLLYKVGKAQKLLSQRLGREATPREIAASLGVSEEDVQVLQSISRQALSIDAVIFDDEGSGFLPALEDTNAPAADEELAQQAFITEIEGLLEHLTSRERDIVVRHFGLRGHEPETLDEIGATYHLTRERIRQIEMKAKEKLLEWAKERRLYDLLN